MQLMSFSEHSGAKYDLILMDLREAHDDFVARIIWRRYAQLPQIPLVAEYSRDASAGLDPMKVREEKLLPAQSAALNDFLAALSKVDVFATEIAQGYALKWEDSGKSLYVKVKIDEKGWAIVRHQIGPSVPLFETLASNSEVPALLGLDVHVERKSSSIGSGTMYEIEIRPTDGLDTQTLTRAVTEIGVR